jgi:hypothetical protein
MKKTKVKTQSGQEIIVSLSVDERGIHLSYQRVGVDAEAQIFSFKGTESGFDIKSNFSEDLSSDEEKAITDAITEIFEDLGLGAETL